MSDTGPLTLSLDKNEVALTYPGAEGVTFQDARFVLTNPTDERVEDVTLHLKASQGGQLLYEGEVKPSVLGWLDVLEAGESVRLSVFLLLKKVGKGFGSRVNMFGFKAALNWSYEIEASVPGGDALAHAIRWCPSEADPNFVQVEIG